MSLGVSESADHPSDAGTVRLGRAKEATDALRRAVQADSSRADWLSNLGAALMAAGETGESLRLLRRAVSLSPQSPLTRRNLGRALLAGKAPAEALDSFREVLRLGGHDAVEQLDLGDAFFASGRHEEAEAAYERGVALEPAVAASREGSRAAWQIIRLGRARRELGNDAPGREAGATVWAGMLAAAHGVKPWLASLGRTPARRISTAVVLVLVVLVARGALVLLPHYVAHHRLHDDIVRLAREPNYDDRRVREEILRAVHTYGRDRYVSANDVQVQRFSLVRHVTFGYEVPMTLLPGLTTRIPFRMEVEEPCLVEPPPVVL